jgi:hypothetical protein
MLSTYDLVLFRKLHSRSHGTAFAYETVMTIENSMDTNEGVSGCMEQELKFKLQESEVFFGAITAILQHGMFSSVFKLKIRHF